MRGTAAKLALLGFFSVLLAACGAAPRPADGAVITVTLGEARTTVQARVGDTVRVVLDEAFPVPGSSLVWSVASSDASILSPGPTSGQPSPAPNVKKFTYRADFSASAAGQALLLAHGVTSCEAMAKSSCPDKDFQVTVTVGA